VRVFGRTGQGSEADYSSNENIFQAEQPYASYDGFVNLAAAEAGSPEIIP
jgi:hypothetical protein